MFLSVQMLEAFCMQRRTIALLVVMSLSVSFRALTHRADVHLSLQQCWCLLADYIHNPKPHLSGMARASSFEPFKIRGVGKLCNNTDSLVGAVLSFGGRLSHSSHIRWGFLGPILCSSNCKCKAGDKKSTLMHWLLTASASCSPIFLHLQQEYTLYQLLSLRLCLA